MLSCFARKWPVVAVIAGLPVHLRLWWSNLRFRARIIFVRVATAVLIFFIHKRNAGVFSLDGMVSFEMLGQGGLAAEDFTTRRWTSVRPATGVDAPMSS